MNRLENVINNLRGDKPSPRRVQKSEGRLEKAISKGKAILEKAENIEVHDTDEELYKGVHDQMYHHALHAKAAERACYHSDAPKGDKSTDHTKKCREFAKKHMSTFLELALKNAKKSNHASSMKYALDRAVNFYDSCCYDCEEEMQAAVLHYAKGGKFKGAE